MDESPITLSVSMGVTFFLAVGVTYAIQGIKWLCEMLPTTKTNHLPGWLWVVLSMGVAAGICVVGKVDALTEMFSDAFSLAPPWSYLVTGFGIGVSSNVVYVATKPLRKKYKTPAGEIVTLPHGEEPPAVPLPQPEPQPQPEPVPEPVVSPAPVAQQRPGWPTAHLLQDVTPTNGKTYWIALDPPEGAVYPLKGGES